MKSVNIVHLIALFLFILSRFLGNTGIAYYLFLIGLNYTYGGLFLGTKYLQINTWQYWIYVWGGMAIISYCGGYAYHYFMPICWVFPGR